MKKHSADVHGEYEKYADIGDPVYLASDVDAYRNTSCDIIAANGRALMSMVARINELEKALREIHDLGKEVPLLDEAGKRVGSFVSHEAQIASRALMVT